MKNKVYLGLGSNKGDKSDYIKRAISALDSLSGSKVTRCSSLYETIPYGSVKQDNFFNAVCEFLTEYSLPGLFEEVKNIENKLGRQKGEKWGPREIDIDILLYNDLIYADERLAIPHKELIKRDFVVIPLLELNPAIIHPELKIKLADVTFTEKEKYIIRQIDINLLKTVGD